MESMESPDSTIGGGYPAPSSPDVDTSGFQPPTRHDAMESSTLDELERRHAVEASQSAGPIAKCGWSAGSSSLMVAASSSWGSDTQPLVGRVAPFR